MLRPFGLYQPSTVAEASELLAREGRDTSLYAGGTEVLLILKEGLLRVQSLIDVKRLPGLRDIRSENGHVVIGATATHRAVESAPAIHERCPMVAGVARHVANIRVRNVGTVGGNLAFADPHSDLATLLLVFNAVVRLEAQGRRREVPLTEFVRGPYETAREDDELLTFVRLTPWPAGTAGAYVKFGLYERPTLGVAVALMRGAGDAITEARVAVGCVGPRPQRVPLVEERLRGWTPADVVRHADEMATLAARDIEPTTDLHGSAAYKKDMTRVFVKRTLVVAAARAAGRTTTHERYPHTIIV